MLAAVVLGAAVQAQTTLTYQEDTRAVLNPERGFYTPIDLLSEADLSWVRAQDGHTLAQTYVRLDAYRTSAIPQAFLEELDASFDVVRDAGLKVILRFAYNFGPPDPDAPLDRILQHIDQLAPVLRANADVIAVLQAGFIGAWGEWHSSPNGNTTPEARAAVLGALLDALPEDRGVQLRYPADLIEQFPTPLPEARWFDGSDQARTGHHNDCFLSNEEDSGTYYPVSDLGTYYGYLDGATPYAAVGGETCQLTPAEQRTDCATTLGEMGRFHWTYINHDFWEPALDRWRDEGCYDDIRRRLGHRFRLLEGTYPEAAAPGSPLSVTLAMTNDGFAGLRNPRGVELVLRPADGGADVRLPADVGADPRRVFPGGGETASLTLTASIPTGLAAGPYALLLNLPDPAPRLDARPAYSLRLANQGVWEPATGYNALGATLQVGASTGVRSVALTSPSSGAVLTPGATVTLAADATGDPTEVTFFAGARRLGTDRSAPFAIDKKVPNQPGTYVLTAEATYADGATATSGGVSVQVGGGAAARAPGAASAWADEAIPEGTALSGVWPNPTRGGATVAYALAEAAEVRVAAVDALGREVAVLAEGRRPAGRYEAAVPTDLAAGVYVVRLAAGGASDTRRLTVLR